MAVMRRSVGHEILIYALLKEDFELPLCGPKVKPDVTAGTPLPPTVSFPDGWLSCIQQL